MSWGAQRVTVRFSDHVVLDDITLDAPSGAVTGIVGGDGAGKTTLLRCLVGALAPGSGEIRRPPAIGIGYLPSSSGTYPDLSVRENLAFTATAYGVPASELDRRIAPYLERTGLAEVGDRLAGRLSGGMRQKLGVIRAMVHRPELLVLDEPTTGVDPVSRADLWWLIAHAAAEGAAVILATAYLDEAERAAHLLALDAGRRLAEGTAEEIAAAVDGTIVLVDRRPEGVAGRRAWRRGARWRIWVPEGSPPVDGIRQAPDLHDAVTVAALARELRTELAA
jgi:ABC-2 type transport system ATP-binding protein